MTVTEAVDVIAGLHAGVAVGLVENGGTIAVPIVGRTCLVCGLPVSRLRGRMRAHRRWHQAVAVIARAATSGGAA